MATISGVLAYVKLQSPDFKYGSTTDKEFSVNLVVTKAEAKAWNKEFPKQKAREVDRADFEKAYKIAPPTDDDEFFVLSFKKPAQYRDGNPIPDAMRPRAFVKNEDNGKLQDITKDVLIANGSVGTVSYDVRDNEFGHFSSLKAVRVDKLIEYKQKGGGNDFSELGDVESLADDFSDVPERVQSDAQKAVVNKVKPQADLPDADDEFDNDPF